MEKKNKSKHILGLVITDGVGFRNFALSNFLEEAKKEFQKIVIYSGLPSHVYDTDKFPDVEIIELPVFKEPQSTWFWRKFKETAHLRLHKEFFGIKVNWQVNRTNARSKRGFLIRFIYRITEFFHSENFIQYLEGRQFSSVQKHVITKECRSILIKTLPSVLFFTHQRPPYLVPMLSAARSLKIEVATFIFSWDNLASKGRMASDFESYVVWSELMKKELHYFYPHTRNKLVSIAGTPQFEPYTMEEYEMEFEEFCEKFNIDREQKTICYSCGDVSTSKNDALYIGIIAKAIEDNLINEQVNLIVRTSPAEEPDRFQFLKVKYPFIIWNFPKWKNSRTDHPEQWSQRVPTREDIRDLRAILTFSDIGINMCSTMTLDFLLFNKPVINPVLGNSKNGLYDDQRFLEFDHYKKVVESKAVAIAKDRIELIENINFSLKNPLHRIKGQKEIIELEIGKPLEGTSKRIVTILKNMVKV